MFLGLKQDFENHHVTPLEVLEHQWSVVKSGDQWHLISNVCPHQYSKILRESGSALVCPYHGFAFDLDGLGINNQCKLQRRSCFVNGDIIFDQPVARHFPVDLSHFNLPPNQHWRTVYEDRLRKLPLNFKGRKCLHLGDGVRYPIFAEFERVCQEIEIPLG